MIWKKEIREHATLPTVRNEALAQRQESPRPANLLDVIHFAVSSPEVDVAKLEAIVRLQERMEERAAKIEFDAALARLQAKLPQIHQGGQRIVKGVLHNRYAKLEDIDVVLRPLLAEEGFSLSFDSSDWTEKAVRMSCTISHRLGHRETKWLPLPIDKSGSMNDTQGIGSTASYARRYLVKMVLNLVERGEDDDGQGGPQPITATQVEELKKLIEEKKANEQKFLAWLGAPSLAEILQRDFAKAKSGLQRKQTDAKLPIPGVPTTPHTPYPLTEEEMRRQTAAQDARRK